MTGNWPRLSATTAEATEGLAGDADGMRQHGLVDRITCIDIDAAHEMDKLSGLRQVVASGFVDRLADEVNSHISHFRVFPIRKSEHSSGVGTGEVSLSCISKTQRLGNDHLKGYI